MIGVATAISRGRALRMTAAFAAGLLLVGSALRYSAAQDPMGGVYAFSDESRGSYFAVDVAATSPDKGLFVFAIPELGVFWPNAPASVEIKSDHSVIVRYDGTADLDRNAVLDRTFGLHSPSGSAESVTIDLMAQINPDRITTSTELRYDGSLYQLEDRRPASSPSDAMAAIVDDIRAEAWDAVYADAYSGFRASVSQNEFVTGVQGSLAPLGNVETVTVVDGPVVSDGRSGFDSAGATISVVLDDGTSQKTLLADVSLIYEAGEWRFINLQVTD